VLASEQCDLAEIILTQLTIKVPNFGPKNSNFACKSQMLRSLGLGLGLETFAKFLRVSVSKKISLGKKVSVSVSEKFGLGKKSRFSVSENLVSEKKYRFRFQKYLVSEKSLGIGFSQNFGFDIQCKTCSMTLTTNLPLFSWNHFRGLAAAAPYCQC